MVRFLVVLSVVSLSAPATLAANGHAIKQRADAVLTLMSYTVVPDVTASDLNIGSGSNDKHNLAITQFGGGATLSESFPLYLEGTMGYSRYDPRFVVSNGEQTRNVPTKWNGLTTTGGVGWDFSLHRDRFGGNLVLRPIVNVMLGTLASDARLGSWVIERKTNAELQFLDGGRFNAWGLGGALMLDYERFSATQDIDAELRYSYMQPSNSSAASDVYKRQVVQREASAENLGLYLRRRAPIADWTLLGKPLRYVLEGAHTEYLGDQRGALGFSGLTSLGIGLELDSSKYPVFITRTRLVARYMFGNNTTGYGVGLAMSF
ncbi:hypothetical protein RAG23_04995 [Klebsiella quasipneumoniae subsp. similipneumoniae]